MKKILMILVLVAVIIILWNNSPLARPGFRFGQKPIRSITGNLSGQTPVMLMYQNYIPNYGDAWVYGWLTETYGPSQERLLAQLREMSQIPVSRKMMIISSLGTMQWMLQNYAADLRASGINYIGYNMERSVGTPDQELTNMAQSVSAAGQLAEQYGLGLIWGPERRFVDQVSPGEIQMMLGSNSQFGLVMQEQRPIADVSAQDRIVAVGYSVDNYRKAARSIGRRVEFLVQIMPGAGDRGCLDMNRCAEFIQGLGNQGLIDGWAIWAGVPQPGRSGLRLDPVFIQEILE